MWRNNGFTLIETLLVLSFILICTSLCFISIPETGYQEMKLLEEMIHLAHFNSISNYETTEIELEEKQIIINDQSYSFNNLVCSSDSFTFNPAGHIEHALTLYCQDDHHHYELIFQLGSGRSRLERY